MPARTTKFEKLLEAVPDALVGMDQKGVIRFVNRQTEVLFDHDRDQLIGRPVETLVPEPLWQIYAQNRDDYFADPRTRSSGLEIELTGLHRDGTEFPVNISMAHIDTGDVLLVITAVADVTRHQVAVRNARLLAAIVDASDDAIIGTTLEGVITSWNPAAERTYGYVAREIIGRSGNILATHDQGEQMQGILARTRAGEVVEHLEINHRRKDGTVVPISLTVAPISDENGTVVGSSAIARDVTEQRRALVSAQRLAAIVESADDAILSGALDGTITSWNPAAERLYGYSGEEIVGKSIDLIIPEDRRDEANLILAEIGAGQRVAELKTVRVRKDGTAIPVSVTVSPIRDRHGTLVATSAVHHDMAAHMLRLETAERLAAIVNSSEDAIIGETLDGVITSWNPAAEAMFGYTSKEIVGQSVSLLVPEDQAGQASAVAAKVVAGQHVEHVKTFNVRKDGTVFPVSLTVCPIHDPDGAVTGASVTCRDVTEQEPAAQYARSLIETALDPLVTISPGGKIDDVNEATVKVTGVPRNKLIGTDFSGYFTDPDKADEGYEQAFTQGRVTDYPLTLRHRDGTLTDVLYNASVYRDAGGRVLGVFAAARDVTQQKKAFEAAQRMAAVVESSSDAIMSGSLDGTITSWNPAAERMYGYSSAEILGKSARTLTPAGRRGEIRAILAKIRAGHAVEHLETMRIRKDGSTFPVSLTVSPVHNADGAVVGSSVIHRDLTEQKGVLAEARRIASIVEYSDDAIIGRTLGGTMTSWNPAAARMFGYSSKEVVGKPAGLLIPEDRGSETISILAKISAGKSVTNFETTRLRKDGTPVTVSLTTSPHRDDEGAVVGASEIYRDVTELKHAAQYARSLIETALDPLVTISPTGKITDVNEATVKATGVPRNKLIGTDFSRYFTDPGKAHEGYERAFTQGSVTDYPLTLRHRDGTLTDVLYHASVYRDPGREVLGVFAAAREVAWQK